MTSSCSVRPKHTDEDDDQAESVAIESFPIDVEGCEKVKCQLCGVRATQPSPLVSACLAMKFGPTIPWKRYVNNKDKRIRRPTGGICAISANVFTCLGLDAQFSTTEYAIFLKDPKNAAEGRKFAKASEEWIRMFNTQEEGGDVIRLKNPKDHLGFVFYGRRLSNVPISQFVYTLCSTMHKHYIYEFCKHT